MGGISVLNNLARLAMFFSSYAPLAAIFLVLYAGRQNEVTIVAFVALIVGIAGLRWILHGATSPDAVSRSIVDYREPGDEVMGYVASYLVPFVGFTLSDLRQDIALAIFFMVLAYLYTSTDMLHINPMLYLLKYHVYEVTFENGRHQHLITKRDIARDDVVKVVCIDRNLWIEGAR